MSFNSYRQCILICPYELKNKSLTNLNITTTDEILEKLEEILENLSDVDKIAVELAQIQRAGLRRHAVTQVGSNRFRFETTEATDAFRGMLIEVAFEVNKVCRNLLKIRLTGT